MTKYNIIQREDLIYVCYEVLTLETPSRTRKEQAADMETR